MAMSSFFTTDAVHSRFMAPMPHEHVCNKSNLAYFVFYEAAANYESAA